MTTSEEKKSTPSYDTSTKIIEEIEGLLKIPEIREYFYRAVLEVRNIFKDEIEDYQPKEVKNKSGENKVGKVPDHPHSLKGSKTYFFEMNKVEDPGSDTGFKWILEKCKFPTDGEAIYTLFNDFINKVDGYEIAPQRIQDELVHLQHQDKWVNIRFTKSSSNRVIGFMKEVQKKVIEEEETERK